MRLAAIAMLIAGASFAPPGASMAQTGFALSANAYLDSTRVPLTRVSAEVPLRNLIFFKRDGFFDARYDVYVSIRRDDAKEPSSTFVLSGLATVHTYDETRKRDLRSRAYRTVALPPGHYKLSATLRVRDTRRAWSDEVQLEVPDFFSSGIGFGTPSVVRVPTDHVEAFARWSKIQPPEKPGQKKAPVSLAAMIFDRQPAVRFEIFLDSAGGAAVPCDVYYEVIGPTDRRFAYGRRRVDLHGTGDVFGVAFDVDNWAPGLYRVNLRATTVDDGRTATAATVIRIEMTRAMLTTRFDETLEMLSYIAQDDELLLLKNASEKQRVAEWEAFWKRRDPDPSTPENEALEQHLERVRYANANFGHLGAGWRTDRGRIYITYGPPDDVDHVSDTRNQGEYLIWRYFSFNRTFVFYDRFGMGDYRLESGYF